MDETPGDGKGRLAGGGWFAHVRDQFGGCQWAFCISRAHGSAMDFKVLAAGTDQAVWRPHCSHGAGSGQWHHPGQCQMTDAELRQELRAAGPASAEPALKG
jgi:hypothetical protein